MDKSTSVKKEKQTRTSWSPSDTELLQEQLQRYGGNIKNAAEDLHRRSLFVEHPLGSVKKKLRDIRQDNRTEVARKRAKTLDSLDSWTLKEKLGDDEDEDDEDDSTDNEEESIAPTETSDDLHRTTGGEKFETEETLEPITIIDTANVWFIWPQTGPANRTTVLVKKRSVALCYSVPPPDAEVLKSMAAIPRFPSTEVPNPQMLRHFKFVHRYHCSSHILDPRNKNCYKLTKGDTTYIVLRVGIEQSDLLPNHHRQR